MAASKGGQVEVSDSDIRTSGANAHGLWTDNGEVIATNSTVDVGGKGAYGAIVSGGATLEVDGGRIVSRQGAALGLDNPDLAALSKRGRRMDNQAITSQRAVRRAKMDAVPDRDLPSSIFSPGHQHIFDQGRLIGIRHSRFVHGVSS